MKTLDKYLVKSFLFPFLASFFIVLFVLVMQTLWMAFDEIAGKGIGIVIILKFLWYVCLMVTPQVLPISVLLASIMTIGTMGEHYEFAAIKSAGISFFRFLRPLMILMFFISIINFIFLNNIFPYANLKERNLLHNIKKTQPALALVEGSFNNELPGYSIKFDKKTGPENNILQNVLILDIKGAQENNKIITAKTGKIYSDDASKYMTLTLYDGYYFEDHTEQRKKKQDKLKMPASRAKFNTYSVNIDISGFSQNDIERTDYTEHYSMKNLSQLHHDSDSLKHEYNQYISNKTTSIINNIKLKATNPLDSITSKIPREEHTAPSMLENFHLKEQLAIIDRALISSKKPINNLKNFKTYINLKRIILNKHDHWFHYVLSYSLSCLLLFFVGAPLGSLIRKGGFGLPLVIAIVIYVIYFFMNTFGGNLSEESKIPCYIGGWFGTIIMLPLAVLFTVSAAKDRGFINFDVILEPIKKVIQRFKKKDE